MDLKRSRTSNLCSWALPSMPWKYTIAWSLMVSYFFIPTNAWIPKIFPNIGLPLVIRNFLICYHITICIICGNTKEMVNHLLKSVIMLVKCEKSVPYNASYHFPHLTTLGWEKSFVTLIFTIKLSLCSFCEEFDWIKIYGSIIDGDLHPSLIVYTTNLL